MRVGYARVSTPDQSLSPQLDALEQSGCGKIFHEVASGAKAERPALKAALDYVRPGDTLVVWRLDRLGRSLGQLIRLVNTLHQRQIRFHSLRSCCKNVSGKPIQQQANHADLNHRRTVDG
jgi:DNA invertase Pin-like site-specific DNA recombinase